MWKRTSLNQTHRSYSQIGNHPNLYGNWGREEQDNKRKQKQTTCSHKTPNEWMDRPGATWAQMEIVSHCSHHSLLSCICCALPCLALTLHTPITQGQSCSQHAMPSPSLPSPGWVWGQVPLPTTLCVTPTYHHSHFYFPPLLSPGENEIFWPLTLGQLVLEWNDDSIISGSEKRPRPPDAVFIYYLCLLCTTTQPPMLILPYIAWPQHCPSNIYFYVNWPSVFLGQCM